MGKRTSFNISVQAIIYSSKQEILLMKRQNTGYKDNFYCLPGGHLETLESIPGAMIRELQEELNLSFKESDLTLFHIINRHLANANYVDFVFKMDLQDKVPINLEPDCCSELVWKKINDLENTLSYIPKLFSSNEMYLTFFEEE